MLFWPRPSERLSSVDFTGFTLRGLAREEAFSAVAEWQAKQGDMVRGRSRCSTIRSNPFQFPCSRMNGAWLGRERCIVTGPCWRDGGPPVPPAAAEQYSEYVSTERRWRLIRRTAAWPRMDGRISQTGRWRDERRGEWVREGHQIQMKTEINKVHYRHPPLAFNWN